MSIRIFSHCDTDGICSATIALAKFPDAEIWFTRPIGFYSDIKEVENQSEIIVCDIALTEAHYQKIFQEMKRLKVTYFDHHPLPGKISAQDVPANMIHNLTASTSELMYKYYQHDLPFEYMQVALYGAIGNYCDLTPFVLEAFERWDKRGIYFQAGIIAQALEEVGLDYDFRRRLVKQLKELVPPSLMPEIVEKAIKSTQKEKDIYNFVKENVKQYKKLAVVIDVPYLTSKAAIYAITVTNAEIGLATTKTKRGDRYDISVRRKFKCNVDLNKMLREISVKFDGSGGGHVSASGARIPSQNLNLFLQELEEYVKGIC